MELRLPPMRRGCWLTGVGLSELPEGAPRPLRLVTPHLMLISEQQDDTGSARAGKQQSGVSGCYWPNDCFLGGCCWGVTDRNRKVSPSSNPVLPSNSPSGQSLRC